MNISAVQTEESSWKTAAAESVEPKKRILVVETDKAGARQLGVKISSAGYETVTHDAANAAMAAKKTPPDLVIVDISMLGEAGFGVAERIQQSVRWCVPTIFVTAGMEPRLRKKAEVFEAAGFFEEPYEAAALLAAIHAVFSEEAVEG